MGQLPRPGPKWTTSGSCNRLSDFKEEIEMYKNNRYLSILVALAISGVAAAGEVPASFDAKSCKAEYPKASLMNEEQGTVSMSFLVNADGSVADSKLEKTSGFKNLDKAA